MKKRVTHEDRVIEYFNKYGQISDTEARDELGNRRLSATIHILRNKGYNIETKMIKGKNRFGDKVEYGLYIYHGMDNEELEA